MAVPFGILLLWVTGLVAALLEGGECFGSDAECQPFRDAGMVHTQVLLGTVVGLTVLSVLAIAVGRRVVPAVLMGASIATLFLGFASFAGHATAVSVALLAALLAACQSGTDIVPASVMKLSVLNGTTKTLVLLPGSPCYSWTRSSSRSSSSAQRAASAHRSERVPTTTE
jgi:hypothetical protein